MPIADPNLPIFRMGMTTSYGLFGILRTLNGSLAKLRDHLRGRSCVHDLPLLRGSSGYPLVPYSQYRSTDRHSALRWNVLDVAFWTGSFLHHSGRPSSLSVLLEIRYITFTPASWTCLYQLALRQRSGVHRGWANRALGPLDQGLWKYIQVLDVLQCKPLSSTFSS